MISFDDYDGDILKDIMKNFKDEMEKAASIEDEEIRHLDMDNIMCEYLEILGGHEGIEIFRNTFKWYA